MEARVRRAAAISLAVSCGLALAYGWFATGWAAEGWPVWRLAIVKASGIVVLAGVATAHRARLLATALLCGAAGDALLALDTQTSFLAGAGAFLIGHLCYIALFLRSGAGARSLAQPPRLFSVLAMIAAAVAGTAWLVPAASPLFAPLSVYTFVLTSMAISTFTLGPSRWLAMLGGVLFFVSDGFVAHNMFHAATDANTAFALNFTGWMTYWSGQAALCLGALTLQSSRATPH